MGLTVCDCPGFEGRPITCVYSDLIYEWLTSDDGYTTDADIAIANTCIGAHEQNHADQGCDDEQDESAALQAEIDCYNDFGVGRNDGSDVGEMYDAACVECPQCNGC
jgi:hypothetical protein